ncbi:Alpha/Beta hydrolase protein [Clohesyomyces aquaticus]|uniref:Alpha/Beta hydrolase protein n=1 Tax=Clohesyomyces aquaticus TaxID=1231657 RepID=A0A1Y1YIT3_9PLEO|nr:Alpha/Beta hydrolase protein [Clohesyomyces aquaticus]
MDLIDPLLINSLASTRRVLLIDYVGVGKSSGTVASSAAECAKQILDFVSLLGEPEIDVLGFSVGGRISQLVALNAPSHFAHRKDVQPVQVRKLIIAGSTTSPSPGSGIAAPSPQRAEVILKVAAAPTLPIEAYETLFFSDDEIGRKACAEWWARLGERSERSSGEDMSGWLDEGYTDWGLATGIHNQAAMLEKFDSEEGSQGLDGSYDRLPSLNIPVLVANGSDDFMVPTINSFVTQQKLKKGKLIVYPNSGHGFLYQYATEFSADVERFLQ